MAKTIKWLLTSIRLDSYTLLKQATEKSIQRPQSGKDTNKIKNPITKTESPTPPGSLPNQSPRSDLSITCFKRVLGAPNGKSNTRNSTLNSTLNTDSLQPWLQVLAKVIFSSPTLLQQCLPFNPILEFVHFKHCLFALNWHISLVIIFFFSYLAKQLTKNKFKPVLRTFVKSTVYTYAIITPFQFESK